MTVWRIARGVYDPLDGEGARRAGGRWNAPGTALVYTSAHLSLAALELLVHVEPEDLPEDLMAFAIELPEDVLMETVEESSLPEGWRDARGSLHCRQVGEGWVHAASSVVLRVPSVVIPQEYNYLINPAHADFQRLEVIQRTPFVYDPRLLER